MLLIVGGFNVDFDRQASLLFDFMAKNYPVAADLSY